MILWELLLPLFALIIVLAYVFKVLFLIGWLISELHYWFWISFQIKVNASLRRLLAFLRASSSHRRHTVTYVMFLFWHPYFLFRGLSQIKHESLSHLDVLSSNGLDLCSKNLSFVPALSTIFTPSLVTPEIAFFYTKQGHNLRNIEEIKSLLNLKFQTFKKTQVMT